MSDIGEMYDDFKKVDQQRRAQNRDNAEKEFHASALLAEYHGLRLTKFDAVHYQLRQPGGWLIELYPGNQRIKGDKNLPPAPFLKLDDNQPWTLRSVVLAAAGLTREQVVEAAKVAIEESWPSWS